MVAVVVVYVCVCAERKSELNRRKISHEAECVFSCCSAQYDKRMKTEWIKKKVNVGHEQRSTVSFSLSG